MLRMVYGALSLCGLTGGLFGFTALTAGGSPRTYDLPIAEVHRTLEKTGLPPMVFGSAMPNVSLKADDPRKVIWIIQQGRSRRIQYVAELEPVSKTSTKVTVRLEAPDLPDRAAPVNWPVKNLYVTAMDEQIASKLEGRDFDDAILYAPMATAVVANMGRLHEQAMQVADAHAQRDRDNVERAYANDAQRNGGR